MFAIVKSAGSEKGKIRSVHRGYESASRNWPVYYKLVNLGQIKVKVGDVRPDLLVAR